MLKTALIGLIAVGASVAAVSSANAADGCGPGFHRGPYGRCHPNLGPGPMVGPGPVVVAPGVPGLGIFYPGRGYWDGHRYFMHRRAWHGGWRYY